MAAGESQPFCHDNFIHYRTLRKGKEVRGQLEVRTEQSRQYRCCFLFWFLFFCLGSRSGSSKCLLFSFRILLLRFDLLAQL